jgi:hypothetical protein
MIRSTLDEEVLNYAAISFGIYWRSSGTGKLIVLHGFVDKSEGAV